MCLKPGVAVLCGDRVHQGNLPEMFKKWDTFYFNDIEPHTDTSLNFQKKVRTPIYKKLKDMGVITDIDDTSSPWIGMNFLSIDKETVIVDKRQLSLIKLLESLKMTVIPVSMRHSAIMKGGLHCCTLDTVREGKLESYFD
jgi:hypothetical protein